MERDATALIDHIIGEIEKQRANGNNPTLLLICSDDYIAIDNYYRGLVVPPLFTISKADEARLKRKPMNAGKLLGMEVLTVPVDLWSDFPLVICGDRFRVIK